MARLCSRRLPPPPFAPGAPATYQDASLTHEATSHSHALTRCYLHQPLRDSMCCRQCLVVAALRYWLLGQASGMLTARAPSPNPIYKQHARTPAHILAAAGGCGLLAGCGQGLASASGLSAGAEGAGEVGDGAGADKLGGGGLHQQLALDPAAAAVKATYRKPGASQQHTGTASVGWFFVWKKPADQMSASGCVQPGCLSPVCGAGPNHASPQP